MFYRLLVDMTQMDVLVVFGYSVKLQ